MLDTHVGHYCSIGEQGFNIWCDADRKDEPNLQYYSNRVFVCVVHCGVITRRGSISTYTALHSTATERRKRKCGRVIAKSLIMQRAFTLYGKCLTPSVWHKGMWLTCFWHFSFIHTPNWHKEIQPGLDQKLRNVLMHKADQNIFRIRCDTWEILVYFITGLISTLILSW